MMYYKDYQPLRWTSPRSYDGANETHIRTCYVEPSWKTWLLWRWDKLLKKRDPFFHREDYGIISKE